MMPTAEDLMLHFRIDRLFAEYCACLDENELERWPELFTEDGSYKMISRENHEQGHPIPLLWMATRGMMVDRIYSLRNANIYASHRYRHAQSGTRITGREGNEIEVSSSYIVVQTLDDDFTEVYQAGSYHDRIVDVGETLLFRERLVVYDTARVKTLLATPV